MGLKIYCNVISIRATCRIHLILSDLIAVIALREERKLILHTQMWSSGQGSWLQIQRSEFDSRHYQIFWEVLSLERGPLSVVSTT
jgi:hypothetical protein